MKNMKLSKLGVILISLSVLLTMLIVLFPDSPLFSILIGFGVTVQKLFNYFYVSLSILGIFLGVIMIILDNAPKAKKEQEELRELYKNYVIKIEGEKNSIEEPRLKKEIVENIEIKNKKRFRIETIPLFDHVNYEVVSFDKENKIIELKYFSDNN